MTRIFIFILLNLFLNCFIVIFNPFSEISTKTASSTEAENFKFNPNIIILESNIDPKEWRREVDRVQKLLEIPEHPEFLITNSHFSDLSSANFNNFFHFLNNNSEDISTKIGVFGAFLNRSTCNNQNFELLKSCNDNIGNELNSIRKFEMLISLKDNIQTKLKDSNNLTSELNIKKLESAELQGKMNIFENLFEEINEKIKSNKEREESLKNADNSKTENKIKDRIKQLKVRCIHFKFFNISQVYFFNILLKLFLNLLIVFQFNFIIYKIFKEDIKKMNMEDSIFGSNILAFKKQESSEKFDNDKNEFNKLFSLEEEFEEIL